MIKSNLISIVIPIYNTPIEKISRCLDSICSGELKKIEIILIDDGSCEEFSLSYRSLCSNYEKVRYYRKKNGGASQARNYGIDRATGEYITFVDADDYISSSCLQQAKYIIEKSQPDLIIGLTKRCSGNNSHAIVGNTDVTPDTQLFSKENRIQLLGQMLCGTNPALLFPNGYIGAGPWAKLIRYEKLAEVKFDETLAWTEDMVWNIQLIQVCESIVLCKEPWYAYSVYEQSISNGYRKNCFSEFQCAVSALLDTMERFWPQELEGFNKIYSRIWGEIWMPCRTLIFHSQNTMTKHEKRELLKRAIQTDAYQIALKQVDFSDQQHWSKRLVKEFLRFAMCHKWYSIVYIIMKYTSRRMNNKINNSF